MRILLSIVLIFFAVTFLVFSEKELNLNDYSTVFSKIQAQAEAESNLENEEQTIAKSEQLLQGYGISSDGTVTLDDEYFGYLYYEIEKNPRQYAGQQVVVTGFVHKEPDSQDNELEVARIQLPKCGSEEAKILGLMCTVEDTSDFQNDEWVIVKGTLSVESYINPMTNSERYKYYIEPENIEKIQRNSDYTIQ